MTRTIADSPRILRTSSATAPAEPRSAHDTVTHPVLLRFVKPLASLKLTVVLLGLSIFLVFAGTLAQVDQGIWQVMEQYFRTKYGVAWIDLPIFFPRSWNVPDVRFPYPGGYLLGGLLLANLLAAHAVRFTLKAEGRRLVIGTTITVIGAMLTGLLIAEVHFAVPVLHDFYVELLLITIVTAVLGIGFWYLFNKRCGITMLHAGLIILLASEAITGWFAVEGQMTIEEGGASNFLRDIRYVELAVIDPDGASDPQKELVTVVPASMLWAGSTIEHPALPFAIEVEHYMSNTGAVRAGAMEPSQTKGPVARLLDLRTGQVLPHAIVERPEVSGVDPNQPVDMPAVDVTLKDKQSGEKLFDGRLSLWHTEAGDDPTVPGDEAQPVTVAVDDKQYEVSLRFKRIYKPYTFHLKDFEHDVYLGTTVPKDYRSHVRLVDPTRNEDRNAQIWMNNPLRYAGYTFFQSSFRQDLMGRDYATVLQVVENPGRIIPYLSCIMVAGGLVAHFFVGLSRFTKRRMGA